MDQKTSVTVRSENTNAVSATVNAEIISSLVLKGDIRSMTPVQKVEYYNWLCTSLELNPATQPFAIINLNGKEVMYALKSCTEQLRTLRGVSVDRLDGKSENGLYIVTAIGHDKSGRTDAATGAVNINGLKGDVLANAIMKAETKAKRRLTLSICGLGILDESEIETIQNAEPVTIEMREIIVDDKSNPMTAKKVDVNFGVHPTHKKPWSAARDETLIKCFFDLSSDYKEHISVELKKRGYVFTPMSVDAPAAWVKSKPVEAVTDDPTGSPTIDPRTIDDPHGGNPDEEWDYGLFKDAQRAAKEETK